MNAWSQLVHFQALFCTPDARGATPERESVPDACAVTVRGIDAGNSTQDHQLVPGRRPEQSSLNIVNKVGSNLETLKPWTLKTWI